MKQRFSYIILAISLLLSLEGYSQCEEANIDSIPYLEYGFYLDEKPYFAGGKDSLINWFSTNINYPSVLSDSNLQITCYLKVIADTNGKISLIETFCSKVKNKDTEEYSPVLQDSIVRFLNYEVVRLISVLPNFVPGRHRGKDRAVSFIFTLKFNPYTIWQKFLYTSDPFIIPIYPIQ